MAGGVRLNAIKVKIIAEGKDSSHTQLLPNHTHTLSHGALGGGGVRRERDPAYSDDMR